MTKICFDNGNIVTIKDGFVLVAAPELTALLDALAATLSDSGSPPFERDGDFNILRGIIEKIGAAKIVARLISHRPFEDIGRDRQFGAELPNATG